uniref:Uncharacterized protein n=1 Tax=Yersinia enterocolitica W22703 TaxID=913028 RepID=F4N141_YEREN|nr:unknown protein [Yersinia enterocolitica W22703]
MERQLKKLSLSGVAMAILLTIAPNDVFAMHIMEGFFTADVGAGLVDAVPAVFVYGAGSFETDCR